MVWKIIIEDNKFMASCMRDGCFLVSAHYTVNFLSTSYLLNFFDYPRQELPKIQLEFYNLNCSDNELLNLFIAYKILKI